MAKKDRNKRAARQARQAERAAAEAIHHGSQEGDSSDSKAVAKATATKPAKVEKKADKKPGFFGKIKNYFSDVRVEMHRVVWPSKKELRNYTLAVVGLLIVFGVVIWLLDTGVVAALVGYSGLRG
jgi:preprotein translocase subunit SecE